MKKSVLIISSVAFLAIFSCKKSTDGNKNVIVEENVSENVSNNNGKVDSTYAAEKTVKNGDSQVQEYTYRYVADDGSSALVTFKNSDKENTISIKSNNKTITLPQKEAWAKGAIYSDGEIELKSENDSVIITQGNAVIGLRKAKGQ